ncbi:hypothetical protein RAA17_21970 [Komagataeibacter rhaeticus]|nr:hypothetical protein [Komagataeibacter rhaeticus]
MIGPGTGIAPFRGFLQERAARKSSGRNWLFFGERHAEEGFYYRDELDAFLAGGVLTRLDTAFSRDQPERVYVQDRMEAAGAELWHWLREGRMSMYAGMRHAWRAMLTRPCDGSWPDTAICLLVMRMLS